MNHEQNVIDETNRLMSEGEEYDPFLISKSYMAAFAEAVSELDKTSMQEVSSSFRNAKESPTQENLAAAALLLNSKVESYWRAMASRKASESVSKWRIK